jgi:heat-inducible transcriptional repressor
VLDRVGSALSAATQGASLVLAPKHEAPIQHIDFVPLSPEQALVVLVFSDGHVENRIFNAAGRHDPSAMREAANFSTRAGGADRLVAAHLMAQEIETRRREIDALANSLIESGLAVWENAGSRPNA